MHKISCGSAQKRSKGNIDVFIKLSRLYCHDYLPTGDSDALAHLSLFWFNVDTFNSTQRDSLSIASDYFSFRQSWRKRGDDPFVRWCTQDSWGLGVWMTRVRLRQLSSHSNGSVLFLKSPCRCFISHKSVTDVSSVRLLHMESWCAAVSRVKESKWSCGAFTSPSWAEWGLRMHS